MAATKAVNGSWTTGGHTWLSHCCGGQLEHPNLIKLYTCGVCHVSTMQPNASAAAIPGQWISPDHWSSRCCAGAMALHENVPVFQCPHCSKLNSRPTIMNPFVGRTPASGGSGGSGGSVRYVPWGPITPLAATGARKALTDDEHTLMVELFMETCWAEGQKRIEQEPEDLPYNHRTSMAVLRMLASPEFEQIRAACSTIAKRIVARR